MIMTLMEMFNRREGMNAKELTRNQIILGNIFGGIMVVAIGIFLLIIGLGAIKGLTLKNMALPTILACIGIVFLFSSIIQRNSLSMWIACAFLLPAIITYIVNFTPLGYRHLYPLYIAIPSVACIGNLFLDKHYKFNIKIIFIFGIMSGVFALQSSGLISMSIVFPIFIVIVGIVILLGAMKITKKTNRDI